MADFCKQCSLEHFGHDFKDMAGLTTPEDVAIGMYAVVLCEGCGPVQVDEDGSCISEDCEKQGHK